MADVAVVIPARNAAATLPKTLAALAAQTYAGEVELVVVDDRSTDATPRLAEAAGARVLSTIDGGGPAEARNAGVAATTAPLIAFTDADCEPAPDWLERGVARLDAAELVQGRITPPPGAPIGFYDRTLHVTRPSPLYETANLLVTRAAFERAGGFPRVATAGTPGRGLRLPPGVKSFAEDTLFGWAVRRTGARAAWAPDALVHHAVFPRRARGYIAERERLAFFPPLVHDVPELREHLVGRVFLSPRSATFDLLVAGVIAAAVTRKPLLAAAAAVPYARVAGPPWPPKPWALKRFVAYAAADAVGLAALLRGSAVSRTLVL